MAVVIDRLLALGKGRPSRAYADVGDGEVLVSVEGRAEPRSQDVQLYDVVQLAYHFGVSVIGALYRLQNLRAITEEELGRMKAEDEAGRGREIARLLGLEEPDHQDARNEFRRRFVGLGLEAFRRRHITRAKLVELAAMVDLREADVDALLREGGLGELAGGEDDEPAVLLPDR